MAIEVHGYKHSIGDFQPLRLRRTALARGLEFVRAGMVIEADGKPGLILDGNDSGNFDVIFTISGLPGNGHIGNVHPRWKTRYFDEQGNVIQEFL